MAKKSAYEYLTADECEKLKEKVKKNTFGAPMVTSEMKNCKNTQLISCQINIWKMF